MKTKRPQDNGHIEGYVHWPRASDWIRVDCSEIGKRSWGLVGDLRIELQSVSNLLFALRFHVELTAGPTYEERGYAPVTLVGRVHATRLIERTIKEQSVPRLLRESFDLAQSR